MYLGVNGHYSNLFPNGPGEKILTELCISLLRENDTAKVKHLGNQDEG